jgi:hypothetical protein
LHKIGALLLVFASTEIIPSHAILVCVGIKYKIQHGKAALVTRDT